MDVFSRGKPEIFLEIKFTYIIPTYVSHIVSNLEMVSSNETAPTLHHNLNSFPKLIDVIHNWLIDTLALLNNIVIALVKKKGLKLRSQVERTPAINDY